MYLRCSVHAAPAKWKAWLHLAEFWYNTSFHSALGCSPFKTLYGYDPDMSVAPVVPSDTENSVAEIFAVRKTHTELLKEQLGAARNRMKTQADKHRTDRVFQVGELVLLKLQPYAQHSVVNRSYPKLSFKFFGPYKVLERIGEVAYRLELPKEAKVHPVFHVSQLKQFTPKYTPVYSELPVEVDMSDTSLKPMKVLECRLVKKGNHATPQVLVQGSNLPDHATTWEDWYVLAKRFPEILAWGQASSEGGEGVTAVTGGEQE